MTPTAPEAAPAITAAITSLNAADPRVRRFWALVLSGLFAFFLWLTLFAMSAGVVSWPGRRAATNSSQEGTLALDPTALTWMDVWFALILIAALDALAVVANFNRALIHQFHFFVSLRMATLAFVLATGGHFHARGWSLGAVTLFIVTLHTAVIVVTERVHKLLPPRGVSRTRGSLHEFSEHMSVFDVPWRRAVLYAAVNGAVGYALTTLVPPAFSMFNPVVHITWEVTFLGLMGTKQTPRYIWFATPLVQASTCTDWGLRQIAFSPAIVLSPVVWLALLLTGRFLFDLHLRTLFRDRLDFQWARAEVLVSTRTMVLIGACLLALEYVGIPLITYMKVIAVVGLHACGVLVFLVPASYALAFDRTKVIRES